MAKGLKVYRVSGLRVQGHMFSQNTHSHLRMPTILTLSIMQMIPIIPLLHNANILMNCKLVEVTKMEVFTLRGGFNFFPPYNKDPITAT